MIPFNGNKILTKNIAKDSEWYQSILALDKAIHGFVKEYFDKVNKWTGSEDGAEAYFVSATTADKLNDFSSLESGGGAVAASPSGGAATSSAGVSANAAIGDELAAVTKASVDAMRAAAEKIEN